MQSPDTPSALLRRVEAARYALLRRLTLAMRHRMLSRLHPIGVMGEVLQRRLREPAPDIARLGADLGRMNSLAREAVDANLDMITWLAPDAQGAVPLDVGIADCVALLRSHLAWRGFLLRHAGSGAGPAVSRGAVRAVLPAVLLAFTDEATAPARVEIASDAATGTVRVSLHDDPQAGVEPAQPPYRAMEWGDVEALARWDGVALEHAPRAAVLRFPSA